MTGSEFTWTVGEPPTWPAPPLKLSHSAFRDIESCPRQWALAKASYSFGPGYPRRYTVAAVAGLIVHGSVELVANEAGAHRGSPIPVVQALRSLGGLSSVVQIVRHGVIERVLENPRMHAQAIPIELAIARRLPEILSTVRHALALMGPIASTPKAVVGERSAAFGVGFHTEVRLSPESIPWVGWADAINVTSDGCEIVDYKTGEVIAEHAEQLRLYATLWRYESGLNPRGTAANSLRIVYPDAEVRVPSLSESELADQARELSTLFERTRAQLTQIPPAARPDPAICTCCDLRHLCPEFWSTMGAGHMPESSDFRSMQLVVQGRRASDVWDVLIEVDATLASGSTALLVDKQPGRIALGDRLRILGARLDERHEGPGRLIVLTPATEVFVVEPIVEPS